MTRLDAHVEADKTIAAARATGCCEVYDDPMVYVCTKRYMEWLTGAPCDIVQDAEDLILCDEHKNVFKPLAVFDLIDLYWNMEEVK